MSATQKRNVLPIGYILLIWFMNISLAHANDRTQSWERIFGGPEEDVAYALQTTSDGGYVIAGWTASRGNGLSDVWIVKLDEQGNREWERIYGGHHEDKARAIQRTPDGGYILAGETKSKGEAHNNAWVIKLDRQGRQEWDRTFGELSESEPYAYSSYVAHAIQITTDGGYILAGEMMPTESGIAGGRVTKLDVQGNQIWERVFGGDNYDGISALQVIDDSGYILVGDTYSYATIGFRDGWVLRINGQGTLLWFRTFNGGRSISNATAIQMTDDSGYIITGITHPACAPIPFTDGWVLKLDRNGNKLWDQTFGNCDDDDWAYDIQTTHDRGYIVAGYTESAGEGQKDAWLIKLDEWGNKLWERTFGGIEDDIAYSIQTTPDGGSIVAGSTASAGAGKSDAWLL